jgi:NADPH:quinone reductase-like Zn-dependent oxidoreductase
MKAAVVARYGSPDVVKIADVAKPVLGLDEVLIRVHATTVNRTDCGELRAHPFFMRFFTGLLRPRRSIFGLDIAGKVEEVGAAVGSFKPGDSVFGICSTRKNGAHAEYAAVSESALAVMPEGWRFEDAVLCEGAFYANAVLKKIALGPGQSILIYGASGAIGIAMVQLAKAAGGIVTVVVATRHVELVQSLGADRVVDYTREDFTRIGARFDFVVDAVGKTTFFRCRKLLKPEGVFAATDLGAWGHYAMLAIISSILRNHRVVIPAPRRIDGFPGFLQGLMQTGQFKAIVDRTYPLEDIANAYRYVETGQKVGIVVVSVAGGGNCSEATGTFS